jgi:PBSX family phage terminase large subunit
MNNIKQYWGRNFDEPFKLIRERAFDYFYFKGGRGSGKSTFISLAIVLGIIKNSNSNAIIYRKVSDTLYDSVYTQILWAIDRLNLTNWFKYYKQPMKMVYLPTGQEIMFKGCDDPQKSKSIKPKKGYFGYCWFEEATDFQGLDEIENIVQSVARSGLGKTAIFLSYNPPQSVQSWINAEVLRPQQNRFVHHSTYLSIRPDLLGEQFIKIAEYKKQTNEKQYNHIYLGEVTGTGGEVFDNVETKAITDEEIEKFDYLYTGLDFGFAVDPVAIVKASYNSSKKELYIFDEFYKVGASFDLIAEQLQKMGNPYTIADSAEPRSIYELKKRDCRIVGAKKGSGSVEHGLKCLQDLNKIVIDPARCPNTVREFCTYEYELDKYGNYKSIYPDKNNHAIDATRYALEDIFRDNNIYSM